MVERFTTRLQKTGERRSRSMRFLVTIDGSNVGVGMPQSGSPKYGSNWLFPALRGSLSGNKKEKFTVVASPVRGVAFSLLRPTQSKR
jgi:hypothetical protein